MATIDRSSSPHSHKKQRKVVFVDPDDSTAPYWWPAMVVPADEIVIFKQTMDTNVREPGRGEHLVCYFEDASFSTVPESALNPFDPSSHPYTTYRSGPNADAFRKDKAVLLATQYWDTGAVPLRFTWIAGAGRADEPRDATKDRTSGRDHRPEGTGGSGGGEGRARRRESVTERTPRRESVSGKGGAREKEVEREGGGNGVGSGRERVRGEEPGGGGFERHHHLHHGSGRDGGQPKHRKDSVGGGGRKDVQAASSSGQHSRKPSISSPTAVSSSPSSQAKFKPSKPKSHSYDSGSNNSVGSRSQAHHGSSTSKHHPSSTMSKSATSSSASSPAHTTTHRSTPSSPTTTKYHDKPAPISPRTVTDKQRPRTRPTTPASPTKPPKTPTVLAFTPASTQLSAPAPRASDTLATASSSSVSNSSPAKRPLTSVPAPALRPECAECGMHVRYPERVTRALCESCLTALAERAGERAGERRIHMTGGANVVPDERRGWEKEEEGWEEPVAWVLEEEECMILEVDAEGGRDRRRKREDEGRTNVQLLKGLVPTSKRQRFLERRDDITRHGTTDEIFKLFLNPDCRDSSRDIHTAVHHHRLHMEQGTSDHILQPLFNHTLPFSALTVSSSALPPPLPPSTPPSPPFTSLALKPVCRKRPHTASNGLVRPVRSHLHHALGDAIMGKTIGIVGAGNVRVRSGSVNNAGREEENGIAAKSLHLIIHQELVNEKRAIEDLKTAIEAHLYQLHGEETMLNGMLDISIEGVVVPRMPIREEDGVVVCGMGFGENGKEGEGTGYGSVGEEVEMDVQEERIRENWAGELGWEGEEEEGVNGSPTSSRTDSASYYDADQPNSEGDEDDDEDEEMALKALSMMLEQYGGGGA